MKGKIWLDAQGGCIAFRYSPQLFAALSNTTGARYDRGFKHWRIPLEQLHSVLKNPLFSKKTFNYAFSEQDLQRQAHVGQEELVAARKRWSQNPFCVDIKDLLLVGCELIIQDGSDGNLLAYFHGTAIHKKKLLKLHYLHYIKRLRAFSLSAQYLHIFLKYLRDSEISFGVEKVVSELLKSNSTLRQQILDHTYEATGKEMIACRLSPVIDSINGNIVIHGLLAEISTKINATFKKRKGSAVSPSEALSILHSASLYNIEIWEGKDFTLLFKELSPTLYHEFKEHQRDFHDSLVWYESIKAAWITRGGIGGLIIDNSLREEFTAILEECDFKVTWIGVYYNKRSFLAVHALNLPDFYSLITEQYKKSIPLAHSFKEILSKLSEKSKQLKKQAWYHEQLDCQIADAKDSNLLAKLYPHQRVSVQWILNNEYGLLGDDMGLGKTLSILAGFNELLLSNKVNFLLVVCPNSLVLNWVREAKNWLPSLTLVTIPSDKRHRESFLRTIIEGRYETIQGIVVNFETARLETVWPLLKEITTVKDVFLAVDESQRVKNSQSQTFKSIKQVSEDCKRRFLLSGTPAPRDVSDIWGQMFMLDRGERLGRNYLTWLKSVAELGTQWSEYAVKKFIPEQVAETRSYVHEVLLRRKKEDVLSLPEKTFLFRDVELSGDQKLQYDRVREELLIRVQTVSGEKGDKLITSILEEYLRAVQMASNPRLIDPSWSGDPAKFIELDEIVNEIVEERGEKIVIWTNYLKNINELCLRYKQFKAMPFSGEVSSPERALTVEQFQKDMKGPRILVAVPAAGGVGITLTAAQTAVYVDRTWNAEHWMQSIDRIHRIGQKGTVRIIVLNACKVDELIGFNLRRKEKQLHELMKIDGEFGEEVYPTRSELIDALK